MTADDSGQGVRVRFFAYFLVTQQESKAASGAATPRPYWPLTHIPGLSCLNDKKTRKIKPFPLELKCSIC